MIQLSTVQFQLHFPAGTELGKTIPNCVFFSHQEALITHITWEGDSLLNNGAQCLIIPPPATVTNTPLAHLLSLILVPVSLSVLLPH